MQQRAILRLTLPLPRRQVGEEARDGGGVAGVERIHHTRGHPPRRRGGERDARGGRLRGEGRGDQERCGEGCAPQEIGEHRGLRKPRGRRSAHVARAVVRRRHPESMRRSACAGGHAVGEVFGDGKGGRL